MYYIILNKIFLWKIYFIYIIQYIIFIHLYWFHTFITLYVSRFELLIIVKLKKIILFKHIIYFFNIEFKFFN